MNHESMPGPVAIASQTCSGVAAMSMSWVSSNLCDMSGLLGLGTVRAFDLNVDVGVDGCRVHRTRNLRAQAGVDRDDDAVVAAAFGVLVVIAADQRGHRRGQLLGERGPVGRGGEPHRAV